MAKNNFVKSANVDTEFDAHKLQELKKCAEDPVYFVKTYCYIQHPTLGKIKFTLRPYQERILRAFVSNRLVLLMQPRQTGKSQITSAFALWLSIFTEDTKVLIASNKQKGATDLMNRVRYMYERLPDFLRPGVKFYNRGSIEFDNESVIWSEATTEDTGRGRSPSCIILDEIAHVAPKIQEAMYASMLPTISTGGKGIFMSTPNGDQDLFAQLWRGAESKTNDFYPIFVTIDEIPGRDEAWQAKEKNNLGELKFRQEHLCEFLSSESLLINSLVLQGLRGKTPIYIDKGFKVWEEFDAKKTYIIGADIGQGLGKDFSTIQIFELERMFQVAEFRSNTVKEDQFFNAIKYIIKKISSIKDNNTNQSPSIYWSFENNAVGATISVLYANDETFPDDEKIELISAPNKYGVTTSGKTKPEACRLFKNLLEKTAKNIIINSDLLIAELKNYIQRGAGYEAKHGSTDDLISACLVTMQILKRLTEYEPEIFNKVYSSEKDFYEEVTDSFDDPIPFTM